MVPFDRLCNTTYHQSAIVTIALSCIVSPIKKDIGRKLRFFQTLPAFDTPGQGGWSEYWEYCHNVWYGKARVAWKPDRENSLVICLAVSIEYQRVTDRQTERRTSCDSIIRAKSLKVVQVIRNWAYTDYYGASKLFIYCRHNSVSILYRYWYIHRRLLACS